MLLRNKCLLTMLAMLLACGGGSSDKDTQVDKPDTALEDSATDAVAQDLINADNLLVDVDGNANPETSTDALVPDIQQPTSPKAFVIENEADLLSGPQAVGRLGDFRIESDHIVAIIGSNGHSLWGPYGGGVLDLAPVGGDDHFEEQFPMAGFLRSVRIETMEVVENGVSGEAVIRIIGSDGPIPLVASLIPMAPAGVKVTVEYVVKADSECLEIRTIIANPGTEKITVPVGDALLFSETGKTVGSGAGFDMAALMAQEGLDWIGSDDPDMSFLLAPPKGGKMKLALTQDELTVVTYDSLRIFPGSQATASRCIYPAPGRSLGVLGHFWSNREVPLIEVKGQVLIDTDGYDFTRMSLEMSKDGQYLGSANPDSAGSFSFFLPEGDYDALLTGPGVAAIPGEFSLVPEQTAAPLQFDPPDPGRIDVKIRDSVDQPIPARIMAQIGLDAGFWAERVALVPDLKGEATLFLPPGDYTIQGSHGAEYIYCRVSATVAAGQTVVATCKLVRELEMPGWVAADLHVHSEYGIDSLLNREVRVKAEVVEGLKFWAATDHDVFEDYSPLVAAMGLQDVIVPSIGNEVSPVGRHFNGLGCTPLPTQLVKYFVIPWAGFLENGEVTGPRPEPEIWKSMHDDFSCRVVQINHPRDGQGYFDLVGYDPAVGPSSADPGRFDLTFDAMEIWNSNEDWTHLESTSLPDWYSFLNRGRRIIATGNPDTHALTQWASQPHNLVMVDGKLTETSFYDALLAGRSQVTAAPFIEFHVDGAELGDTVTPTSIDGKLQVEIRVSAPSWAPLDKVRLVANGVVVQEWDVSGLTDVVRLEQVVELTPEVDTWYHVVAFDADNDLAPVYPGRTSAAVTNPIWVDLDGDGFDPPIVDVP